MVVCLKLLTFFASQLGFWELLRRHGGIDVCFLPSLTVACQTAVLFLAGLLGLLPAGAWLLVGAGLLCLVFAAVRDRGFSFLRNYRHVGYVFLAAVLAVMLVFVRGKVFSRYDNFSHWALVVRRMLETDRYPNYRDALITFQEYPLGSASFVYFLARIVDPAESVQMFAQIYMMTACILPVFFFARRNRIAALLVVLSATNFFFIYNVTVTNLLVDTLLPLAGMCALLYAWCFCRAGAGTAAILFSAAYSVQLVQIKNAGLFFAALVFVLLLRALRRGRAAARIAAVLLPLASVVLWHGHCRSAFEQAELSKHAFTVQNLLATFRGKSPSQLLNIGLAMLKFSVTWTDVWVTVAALLLIGAAAYLFVRSEQRAFWKLFALCAALYVLYQAGMLLMYAFSMPLDEALMLAGNTRYTRSILIAVLYIGLAFAIRLLSHIEPKRRASLSAATLLLVGLFFGHMYLTKGGVRTALQYRDDPSERLWLENAKTQYAVPDGGSCCILIPGDDAGYAYYLGRYLFQSNEIETLDAENTEQLDGIGADYLFVYDRKNSVIQEWIQSRYPEQAGNDVIIRGTPAA